MIELNFDIIIGKYIFDRDFFKLAGKVGHHLDMIEMEIFLLSLEGEKDSYQKPFTEL